MSRAMLLAVICVIVSALFTAGTSGAGPTSELFLTSKSEHGGGKSTFFVVQGTNLNRTWAAQHGNEIALSVNDTVRSLGLLDLPAPGDVGAEYTVAGVQTGVDYPMPIASPPLVQFLDGTTDGIHNYAWDFNNGTAYQFDANWANPTALFSLTDNFSRAGITYDPTNHSLWLSQYSGSVVEDRSLSGALLSSFNVGHIQNTALALDPADGTLWLVAQSVGGRLEQYTRAGQFLGSELPPGTGGASIFGGEFQAVPEPGAVAIIIFGSVLLLRRRRAASGWDSLYRE